MSKGTPGLAVIAVVFGAIATSQTPAESTERLRPTRRGRPFSAMPSSRRKTGPFTSKDQRLSSKRPKETPGCARRCES